MKSIKLKSFPGENITDFCTAILYDAEHLESARFNPENLGKIICIIDDTYDSRLHLYEIQKYK